MRKTLLTICMLTMAMLQASAVQVKEKLNRAPVAVKTSTGILVSWRSLAADGDATFSVLRNRQQIATGISTKTNFMDEGGKPGDSYTVVSSKGGEATAVAWNSIYTSINVPRPAARKDKNGSTTGRYRPDDMSVGDVDGDGDYELILKWEPDNARDSGKEGYASPAYIDCYEMDGTQLWRIDTGHGIRSGNHTTQFLVYDFDGDGKAEVIFKTTADTKDGKGNYVTKASTDPTITSIDPNSVTVNSNGRVTKGAELLTVFNGETGAAMKTIWYSPGRGMTLYPTADESYSSNWGDTSYNRGERYNACVAYLDGLDKLPTAIMERGYYTQCFVWAVDWDGQDLKTRWLHRGDSKTTWKVYDAKGEIINSGSGKSSYGMGVHGISVGDVNNDGFDEIVTGAATIGHDGALMCSTGYGHGDAIHLADLCPDRPGLEIMMPHEESPYGYDVHDATTGEVLAYATSSKDNGRGLAADMVPSHRGYEFWSSADNNTYACEDGSIVLTKKADTNFRIYWTGDPYDQTFDGHNNSTTGEYDPYIRIYKNQNGMINADVKFKEYGNPSACNYTKATPCLQADILGDWREELIMFEYETDWSAKDCKLLIYSTPEPTEYKVPCLMEDHVYRMGVAWQNSSYNQPPHLGYYLPDYLGIDGKTYVTQTVYHMPTPPEPEKKTQGEEDVKAPGEDKATIKGVCYTGGINGELTSSVSGSYVKMRTGNSGNTITFNVNDGYIITAVKASGYSNNTSKTADRSIDLTGIYIDGGETSVLAQPVTFPGGTAGQVAATAEASGFEAKQNIVLTFDNSKITTSEIDSAGKNKQIMATVTFTWKLVSTGIEYVETVTVPRTGDGRIYNLQGQQVTAPVAGQIYITGGKKFIAK